MNKIKNFEFKANCDSPELILNKLEELGARYGGEDHQVDTYFNCQNGRLKLREGNIENTLIFYQRSNLAKARNSEIYLDRLGPDHNIKNILKNSHGIKIVVSKKRKIFYIDHVKFHVDTLEDLGSFFEVEVIDETGILSESEMKETCEYYKKIFQVSDDSILSESYSDMLITKGELIRKKLYEKAHDFLNNLEQCQQSQNLNLTQYHLDHLCYRVEDESSYLSWKKNLNLIGEQLIESIVGGRKISTFELYEPIKFKNREIKVLELPAPKQTSFYKEGFEHAEFVIKESFEDFQRKFSHLNFNTKGITKKHNPEIKLSFDFGAIKFHHQSLADIIKREIS